MGLWLKQDDGTLVEVSGGGEGGTGADGVDGKGWTGGSYDPATGTVTFTSDDGLEFTTGDLRGANGIDGLAGADGNEWHVGSGDPASTLGDPGDYYLDGEAGWVWVKRTEASWTNLYVNLTGPPGADGDGGGEHDHDYLPLSGGTLTGDLQVDGNADLKIRVPADFWQPMGGTVFNSYGMIGGSQGSWSTAMTSNGYRNTSNTWTNMDRGDGAAVVELFPTGSMVVRVASTYPTGSSAQPPVHFTVTEAGPTFRAQPSKTRSTDEVLERAETAEFPPEDDEGVATMDGHDEVPLFEVVTALLAKVKEMSARIAELET